jgi:membrane protease YdiL (CAAX protease family)
VTDGTEASPSPEKLELPRIRGGWVVLWLLFGFLIANGLYGTFKKKEVEEKTYQMEQLTLRQAVLTKRLVSIAPNAGAMSDTSKPFNDLLEEIGEDAKTKPAAARLYLAVESEAGSKPSPDKLAVLVKSSDPVDHGLSRLYASPRLSRGAAQRIIEGIRGDGFIFDLAKVQAREKAGIEPSGREEIAPLWRALAIGGAMLVLVLIAFLSLVLWAVYFTLRKSGQVQPLGFPVGTISRAHADRLAIRAAQIVCAFFVLSLLGGMIAQATTSVVLANLVPSVGVLLFVILISKVPVAGTSVTLRDIGVSGQNFGRHFLWGLAGFVIEIPIMILMALLGRSIFKFLPPPEHPASTLLQNRPDMAIVLTVLFFGAMIAPFWEEIMFRGLMLPAVSRVTWGPLAGSIITSLIFAAIHPQGISTWLALGTVAAVSCALAYHTKSLVPSIVMHSLHNFCLLVGTLVLFS